MTALVSVNFMNIWKQHLLADSMYWYELSNFRLNSLKKKWVNNPMNLLSKHLHCVKVFKYRVSLGIYSKCGKIRTRKNSVFGHFSCSVTFPNSTNQTLEKVVKCSRVFIVYLEQFLHLLLCFYYLLWTHKCVSGYYLTFNGSRLSLAFSLHCRKVIFRK